MDDVTPIVAALKKIGFPLQAVWRMLAWPSCRCTHRMTLPICSRVT
jgi:hypothetical protein